MNKESAMKAGQLLMGAESPIFTSDDVVEEIDEERNSRSKTRGPGEQWTREFFSRRNRDLIYHFHKEYFNACSTNLQPMTRNYCEIFYRIAYASSTTVYLVWGQAETAHRQ